MRGRIQSVMCLVRVRKRSDCEVLRELRFTYRRVGWSCGKAAWHFGDSLGETANTDATEGERKTVTALFADIKGSMELMEDLDPEEARVIVDPALKLMIDAVRRYDGYVVQSTGDG